jgi:hypothetical protein
MRHAMKLALVTISLSLASVACDRDDDDGDGGEGLSADATVSDVFLTAGHFLVNGPLTPVDAEEVDEDVREQGLFRNYRVDRPTTEPATPAEPGEDCGLTQNELVVDKSSLTVRYRADSSQCPDDEEMTVKMKVFAKSTCSDTDLTQHEGQTASQLVNQDLWQFCQDDAEQTVILNLFMTLSMTSKDGTPVNITAVGGLMNRDFGPCVFKVEDGRRSVDGCTMRVLAKNGGAAYAAETYELSNAEGDADGFYYDSGKGLVTSNDWQGEVLFAPNANPTYSLSNGSETVSGTIGGSSAFELRTAATVQGLVRDVVRGIKP